MSQEGDHNLRKFDDVVWVGIKNFHRRFELGVTFVTMKNFSYNVWIPKGQAFLPW